MSISTYSDLVTAVGNWLNRDDLATQIPDFIALFEARMNRMLRVPAMEGALAFSTSSEVNALPTDCLSVREVALDADPDIVLVPMTPAELRANYPFSTAATPAAYAIVGTNLKLAPPPSDAVTVNLQYYRSIPALTASADTNWLLTAHPDAYLLGSLCEASAFIIDDDRALRWKAAWDEVLAEIQSTGNKYRTPGAPLAMRSGVIE